MKPTPSNRDVSIVLAASPILVLLMGFSVCQALLGQAALAATSGAAAVALAGDVVRRTLRQSFSKKTPSA